MKRTLLSLFLAVPLLCQAQSNYQSGYVVTSDKDTLKGFIDYKERRINPSSFSFKPTLNDQAKTYSLKDCSAYGIKGMEYFERYTVKISMNDVAISNLPVGLDSVYRVDTVFLRVLQKGKNVTMFSYVDGLKERFYIMDKDNGVPEELVRHLFLNPENNSSVVTVSKYLRQLLAIRRKFTTVTTEEEQKIGKVDYTKRDLMKVVSVLNEQHQEQSKFPRTRFFGGVGLNITNAIYQGENGLAGTSAQHKTSSLPFITGGLDVFANPAIGRLIYRTELSFFISKYEVSNTTAIQARSRLAHTFDQYSAVLTPQLIYNIYNRDHFKFFIGAGVGLNFLKYSNNSSSVTNSVFTPSTATVTENAIKFEPFTTSFPLSAGIMLNKKLEITGSYSANFSLTDYSYFSVAARRMKIGINYMLGKR
ncbi:hypothetical protein [Pedobacter sp. MR2016-24]|uniref:hypothetical protein n=1 Tax=Pedobacter sp. MR2016-24 TaxID=2994466 RepID=UPI002246C17D|nr:hypothetical protein [Pedobacter sp. MR2016-24]MCX2482538.1 hypothetical protein [Pedobacter sp. MR2016-24]